MKGQSLETLNPDLFSSLRRNINCLREKETHLRKNALQDILNIVKTAHLPTHIFDQITNLALKDLLQSIADHSEFCRENATAILIELLPRCSSINHFLPYIFSVLIDRTNCIDLEGISSIPEKMRPAPGQKPKVIVKVVENCEEIRLLYCEMVRKLIGLVDEDEIRKYLDDIVNILRALIMDPSPDVQKTACESLEIFCKSFKMILLHYTEIMGRAVLLPLIAKKSKIRIAALNALTAILWCGVWKYNAFVFQNLVGFRDPNSVPIKDFYEPSHNINYLATFINDENVKVRQEFMRHVKIWICDIQDKYDHHGRLVPYVMSGLFDPDQLVQTTALAALTDIGKQIQIQKEKQFRENKQFAIDAAWTWDGQLISLPLEGPFKERPSLGSRFFVRGHVRKFWAALYKEIKDINIHNKMRACYLSLYGSIYTENYLTQYLDVMLPQLLTSILPNQPEDQPACVLIEKIMFYIGRYCEVSGYIHVIRSALKGELVQNEHFLKAALRALSKLIEGHLEAIPHGSGLQHKKTQIYEIIRMLGECEVATQIYKGNCEEGRSIVRTLLEGVITKAKPDELSECMQIHSECLLKIFGVSYYEQYYSSCVGVESTITPAPNVADLSTSISQLFETPFPNYILTLEEYLKNAYMSPPSLMDADWKLIIVIHNYLTQSTNQNHLVFSLAQEVIAESLSSNHSVEILHFLLRYISYLFEQLTDKTTIKPVSVLLLKALQNFNKFKVTKKMPVYDQHLIKPDTDTNSVKISEDSFLMLFKSASEAIRVFYLNKILIEPKLLGRILNVYLSIYDKLKKDKLMQFETIKTIWVVCERADFNESYPEQFVFLNCKGEEEVVFEQLVDFIVERLETLGEADAKKVNMLFAAFENIIKCCPKIENASVKLPHIYSNYPQLLEKLFKYAMDEKDIEIKGKYNDLLKALCKKLRPWFEFELRISDESRRFIRANLLSEILKESS